MKQIILILLLLVACSNNEVELNPLTTELTHKLSSCHQTNNLLQEKLNETNNEVEFLKQEILELEIRNKELVKDLIQERKENSFKYYTTTWTGCKQKIPLKGNYYIERSNSMLPFIYANHKVSFCIPTKDDINIGDVILFRKPKPLEYELPFRYIIHMVESKIEINGTVYYSTKGYNNPVADMYLVTFSQIVGKLWKIETK